MNVFAKFLILFTSILLVGTAHAQNVHGILRVVKGDVQIKSSKGDTSKARIGGKVFPKDVVITGKDARAKIVMVDNNEINVSPDSQVEIQHYEYDPAAGKKDVLLNVIYGKVRSKVEQKYDGKTTKFQIKTPSAVAGVRGTDFLMGFNKSTNASQVVTFEGKVEFGVPGPGGSIAGAVFVSPGQVASSSAGQLPTAPSPMPKEELAKMDSDTKTETPKVATPGAAASESERTPAADEKKDDKKNTDKKEAPKADGAKPDGAKADGNKGAANGGGSDRAPAAAGPSSGASQCTMCGGPASEAPAPPPMMGAGPVNIVVPPPVVAPLPTNGADQFIRDTIKGGQTNLIIKVNGQ